MTNVFKNGGMAIIILRRLNETINNNYSGGVMSEMRYISLEYRCRKCKKINKDSTMTSESLTALMRDAFRFWRCDSKCKINTKQELISYQYERHKLSG